MADFGPGDAANRVEGLYGVHSLETLRQWGLRHNPERAHERDDQAAAFPPVRQPLVRVHPATGAKSLYVCPAVISHIEGMDEEASAALIEHVDRARDAGSVRVHAQMAQGRSGDVGQSRGAAYRELVRSYAVSAVDVSHDGRGERAGAGGIRTKPDHFGWSCLILAVRARAAQMPDKYQTIRGLARRSGSRRLIRRRVRRPRIVSEMNRSRTDALTDGNDLGRSIAFAPVASTRTPPLHA